MGRSSEPLVRRRRADGQRVREKMLNITQNHNETSPPVAERLVSERRETARAAEHAGSGLAHHGGCRGGRQDGGSSAKRQNCRRVQNSTSGCV